MKIYIDNQNKIAFTLLQILWVPYRFYSNFLAFKVSEISAFIRILIVRLVILIKNLF